MDRLTLEEPNQTFRDSYRSLVQEFAERGERPVPFTLGFPNEDFDQFLADLRAFARGEELPPGFVPHSTYWLVLNGAEVVGASNLRHQLNDRLIRVGGHIGYGVRPSLRGRGYAKRLLALTLERARALGLERVLVTCANDNRPSARVIMSNGGIFESEEVDERDGRVMQRYWVSIEADQADL